MEKEIREYYELVKAGPGKVEAGLFFAQQEKIQTPDGLMIKAKEFRKLEEKFSKPLVLDYFTNYFQYRFKKEVTCDSMEKVLWDAAHLSIAEYLCRNGKESLVLSPLFVCIDYLFSEASYSTTDGLELDPHFWNSYNRGIAYEDNSVFDSFTAIDFLPSYLFNQPLDHRGISRKYLQMIEQSSIPLETKEEYMQKLQQIETAPDNDFYLQY